MLLRLLGIIIIIIISSSSSSGGSSSSSSSSSSTLNSLHAQTLMLTDVQTPFPWDPLSSP